nr:immunoglobulin heavy chain junction region [Macaca mulatta]MOW23261.1 immunoglobulin heavy chain junction region [Macaca mulatta]MOW23454.1 immunoglobulin heavy chain junction region [Macaca mulatta]MOW23526.1 immunoglobulin heavy chain junction region [Macaca mulatta]MOW23572.1 immunoglobulin heavy chain junction region [Macaca mulatta]
CAKGDTATVYYGLDSW